MKEIISKKQLREFGLLIVFGFPILIGWLIPAISGKGFREWSLWIGIPGLILGLFKPYLLLYPYNVWMVIGNALGRLNSYLIFGLIFIFILLITDLGLFLISSIILPTYSPIITIPNKFIEIPKRIKRTIVVDPLAI